MFGLWGRSRSILLSRTDGGCYSYKKNRHRKTAHSDVKVLQVPELSSSHLFATKFLLELLEAEDYLLKFFWVCYLKIRKREEKCGKASSYTHSTVLLMSVWTPLPPSPGNSSFFVNRVKSPVFSLVNSPTFCSRTISRTTLVSPS